MSLADPCRAVVAPEWATILAPIRTDLIAVDGDCVAHLRSQSVALGDLIRHVDASPSRLLHPALLLIAARACGYRGEDAVTYATVVELIHRATLVHQTLAAAGASTSTGRAPRDVTVLLGDYLYVTAMQLALAPGARDLVALICNATLRTFGGTRHARRAPRCRGEQA